jgi:hypothetical protein
MLILRSEEGKDPRQSVRVIEILKNLVHETEVKGMGDVLPHGALLRGELLDPMIVKTWANAPGGDLILQVHSNSTLWELKKAVASVLDLPPRFLQLAVGKGTWVSLSELKDIDNGKTMKALGLLGGETFTAQKLQIEEHVPNAPLVGPDGNLTPAARRVFSEWYDMFCNAAGDFTKESGALLV